MGLGSCGNFEDYPDSPLFSSYLVLSTGSCSKQKHTLTWVGVKELTLSCYTTLGNHIYLL